MSHPVPAPLWFVGALLPMVASQIVRLPQTDPAIWIACDYAGRLGALAVLVAVPSARKVAFARLRVGIAWWEIALWTVAIVAADLYLGEAIRSLINAVAPNTRLGVYPQTTGWLHRIDIVFGLALVAVSEEVAFRRCARSVLHPHVGDGTLMVLCSALLFGAYHWWTGVGNIVATALIGIPLMIFYLRSRALWPVIVAHYLTDIAYFA